MNIPPLHSVDPSLLRAATSGEPAAGAHGETIRGAAREFEGILVRQFLQQALQPTSGASGLMGENAHPMHQFLMIDALAGSITRQGGLGLSSVIQAQLQTVSGEPESSGK